MSRDRDSFTMYSCAFCNEQLQDHQTVYSSADVVKLQNELFVCSKTCLEQMFTDNIFCRAPHMWPVIKEKATNAMPCNCSTQKKPMN